MSAWKGSASRSRRRRSFETVTPASLTGGTPVRYGFIGLGNLGAPLALNLRRAGLDLLVHDIDRKNAEPHLAAGAAWASSPEELAAACDAVITCLPSPAVSERVLRAFLPAISAGSHLDRNLDARTRRDIAPCRHRQRARRAHARTAGDRRRASRRARRDYLACRRGCRPRDAAPSGSRRARRQAFPYGSAGFGSGHESHHQYAGFHSSGGRRRGADAGKAWRARSGTGLGGDPGKLGKQLRARDRGTAYPERQLRYRLQHGSGAEGSRLRDGFRPKLRRAAGTRRPDPRHVRTGARRLWRRCAIDRRCPPSGRRA